MRIIGLDIGTKRIGVAISDEECIIARGLNSIERNGKEIEKIKELIKKYDHNDIVDKIFAFINDENINFGNIILDEYFVKTEEMNDKTKDILIKEFY